MNVKNRTIFWHDNLEILQGMNSESVDLIYLDPPFNKDKKFTGTTKNEERKKVGFEDIFRKESVKDEWLETIKQDYDGLYNFLKSVKELSNIISDRENNNYLYNYCYLVYMAMRLLEMRRILKNTGSMYLHCDNTMGHYLKILMDIIFGEKNFRNEIVWAYSGGGIPRKDFPRKHDTIFRYVKNEASDYCFNVEYKKYGKHNKTGKRATDLGGTRNIYYNEKGTPVNNWWIDIKPIINWHKERTGWPTQKPVALLERIIKASSNEGDVVLDPFCGCATTCIAAEKLGRKWIGIDKDKEAYILLKNRINKELKGQFDFAEGLSKEIDDNYSNEPPKRTDLGKDYRLKKYVYVISNPKYPGEYKVGIAKDMKSRLNSYQTSDPDRNYKIEYKKLTEKFREIEKAIHEKYENKHEWVQGNLKTIIQDIEKFEK